MPIYWSFQPSPTTAKRMAHISLPLCIYIYIYIYMCVCVCVCVCVYVCLYHCILHDGCVVDTVYLVQLVFLNIFVHSYTNNWLIILLFLGK